MNRTNRIDVHPEDLLDAAYKGELDDAGRQRLNEHIAQCAACRLEHGLGEDLAEETAPREDDEAKLSALVASAMGEQAASPAPSRPGLAPRRVAWLTGGALLIGAFGGAAAAWWAVAPAEITEEADEAPTVEEPAAEEASERRPRRGTEPDPMTVEEPEETPEEVEPVVAVEADGERAPRPASAAEMLSSANEARRGGETRRAAQLYRELLARYPDSREAQLSHVSLARLLLDRLDDPQGALEQFDRYLTRPGLLAEEARVGRALALGRLGRTAEERQAWQDLLDHHPSSPHADRARARIAP